VNDFLAAAHATGPGHVLELTGELDFHTAPQVRAALQSVTLHPGQQLVIDLAQVTFCDSSGIASLVAARNHAESAQAGIALAAVPEEVARIFRIIGLDQIFPTYPTAEEAAAAWRS
jgi:anti-sigma B factor antagonist